jgi:hypothetical protein
MKWFVLFNAVLELGAGVVFLFAPFLIPDVDAGDANAMTLCRMYGAAAFALGWYALLVFLNFREGPLRGWLKVFPVFHLGVALASFHGLQAGIESFGGALGLHGILGLICLVLLFTRKKMPLS